MQAFLPYPDFAASAAVLDRARLGKQRVEALQILRTLAGLSSGWARHPVTLQWAGHERALGDYGLTVCAEWTRRGYQDTCAARIRFLSRLFEDAGPPACIGDEVFHREHRERLIAKDPDWYGPQLGGAA